MNWFYIQLSFETEAGNSTSLSLRCKCYLVLCLFLQRDNISFISTISDQLPDRCRLASKEGVAVDGREPLRADPDSQEASPAPSCLWPGSKMKFYFYDYSAQSVKGFLVFFGYNFVTIFRQQRCLKFWVFLLLADLHEAIPNSSKKQEQLFQQFAFSKSRAVGGTEYNFSI